MAGKRSSAPTTMAAAAVAILVVAGAVAGVAARDSTGAPSSLTSWNGAGCSGDKETTGACGCSDLAFYAGQEFTYRGETATLYPETGCAGAPYLMFETTQACGDFGWRSININC